MSSTPGKPSTSELIHELSRWIDRSPANRERDPEALLWGRTAKITEEAGEVISALIAALDHNPRKPQQGTLDDVQRELLDVATTALCAVAHLHTRRESTPDVTALLDAHVQHVAARAGIIGPSPDSPHR